MGSSPSAPSGSCPLNARRSSKNGCSTLRPFPRSIRHGRANPISQAPDHQSGTATCRQKMSSRKGEPIWKNSDPFFERDCDACVRAQANLASLDFGDEAARHIMPVARMAPQAGIGLGQTDPRTVEGIDSADMNAVSTDDFHSRLHAFNS